MANCPEMADRFAGRGGRGSGEPARKPALAGPPRRSHSPAAGRANPDCAGSALNTQSRVWRAERHDVPLLHLIPLKSAKELSTGVH